MLRMDFKILDDRDTLRTNWPNEQLILMQSVVGRAHAGHGSFNRRRYPDTTPDDVARALRLNPEMVRAERQAMIDDIKTYVMRTQAGDPPKFLLNLDEEPILGCSFLRFLQVEAADVLRGLWLGGLRDDIDVRLEVREMTGIPIGGGRCYLVDRQKMWDLGLDGDLLAHGEWREKIAEFTRQGLIVGPERKEEPGVVYQYIRHVQGFGASDDAAIVASGLRWNLGVAVGMFFADVIDTIEKYVTVYSDQDRELAALIEQDFADLSLTREDVYKLIVWATGEDTDDYQVPDSSLRHMLTVDRKTDLTAIESHLLTVMGVPCPSLGLSHDRSPSHRFYEWVRARMEAL
jgi:hypothetical protein